MPISSVRFLLGFVGALVLLGVALTVLGRRANIMEPVTVRLRGPFVSAPIAPPRGPNAPRER